MVILEHDKDLQIFPFDSKRKCPDCICYLYSSKNETCALKWLLYQRKHSVLSDSQQTQKIPNNLSTVKI